MRRARDQTQNVLGAVEVAIRQLLYPEARPYLDPDLTTAVDVELLRILSRALGTHGSSVFHTEILARVAETTPDIVDLLGVMDQIHGAGLFESVLLQELIYLSQRLVHSPAGSDLRTEAEDFVEWLHWLATRQPHDESRNLEFSGKYFKVAFILASKAATAARGTAPYERALGVCLARGLDSIYLLGLTAQQAGLCRQIEARFDEDLRLAKKKSLRVLIHRDGDQFRVPLVHYVRNQLHLPPGTFAERLGDLGINKGDTVVGVTKDVDERRAVVDIDGLVGEVGRADVAWGYQGPVNRRIRPHEELRVSVASIDDAKGLLRLSVRNLVNSPWASGAAPIVGEIRRFRVAAIDDTDIELAVFDRHGTEEIMSGSMAISDWSWFDDTAVPQVGDLGDGLVIFSAAESNRLDLSRREAENIDWDRARKKYARGTKVRVVVSKVEYDGLVVELEPGVRGRINRFDLLEHGHELAEFQATVVPGQRFDAVVKGHKVNRRFITLKLDR